MVTRIFISMVILFSVPNLESLRWHNRVVVIFSSDAKDKNVKKQEEMAESEAGGFSERDMKVFQVMGNDAKAQSLRERLGVSRTGFSVVLIGKDGLVKLKKDQPAGAQELFSLVDSMPMRQQEMKSHK